MLPLRLLRGAAGASAPATPVTSGMLVEYRCDDGSGTTVKAYDSTGAPNATYNGSFQSGAYLPSWSGGGILSTLNTTETRIWNAPAVFNPSTVKTIIVACDSGPTCLARNGQGQGTMLCFGNQGPATLGNHSTGQFLFGYLGQGTVTTKRKNGPAVVAYLLDTLGRIFVDGVEASYARQIAPPTLSSSQLRFGWGETSINYVGRWYWVNAYNRVLTDAEVLQQSNYIMAQVSARGVSFADALPANANVVMIGGDSISEGSTVKMGEDYPRLIGDALTNPTRVHNIATSGQRAQVLAGTVAATVGPICAAYPSAAKKVYCLLIGVNDLAQNRTSTQILADIASIVSAVRTAGATDVLLCTLTDATGFLSAPQETQKTALNAGIVAGVAGVDAVIRIDQNANLGVSGAASSSTYFDAAHLHPTYVGNQAMRDLFLTALAARGIT